MARKISLERHKWGEFAGSFPGDLLLTKSTPGVLVRLWHGLGLTRINLKGPDHKVQDMGFHQTFGHQYSVASFVVRNFTAEAFGARSFPAEFTWKASKIDSWDCI
jgi:hypothetical protein